MRRLFWDIETSRLEAKCFGLRKQFIPVEAIVKQPQIICISYKWEGERKVHSLRWNLWDDKQMVEDFVPLWHEADEMVAHWGDFFDIKWYQGRHMVHNLPPIPQAKTVDTCAIARKQFKLPSMKLDYLGEILGLGRKRKTSLELWNGCENGDPKALDKMVRYCEQDVKLLEKVYHRIAPYHKPKTHIGVEVGKDKWTCASCGSEKVNHHKEKITAAGTVQHQMRCTKCGKYHTINNAAFNRYTEAKA